MPDSSSPLFPTPEPETDAPETEPPETVAAETPIEINTIFLGFLLFLAALAACYAAAEIILPIVLACVLSLVFGPVLRLLQRLRVPRVAAALLIVLSMVAVFIVIGMLLSGPVARWIAQLPNTIPRLEQRLSFLSGPFRALQRSLDHLQSLGTGTAAPAVAVQGTSLQARLLSGVQSFAGGAFTIVLVLFFLLVAGDRFLRRLVEILPRFKDKRRAVDISQQIEHDISVYLATITVMNLLVGIATGTVMWLCGLGDPLLWGTVAFLLNYVPVLGPSAGVVLFLVTGLVTTDTLWGALLPPTLYLMIHIVEGETITPMILARRFTINPVLVMLSLIFWYWMWGVPGAVLSTPMLAIAKIFCDRIEPLQPVGHFIEG